MWKIIRSGHNIAHVMTAELSWHVEIYAWLNYQNCNNKKENFDKISIMSSNMLYEMCPCGHLIMVVPCIPPEPHALDGQTKKTLGTEMTRNANEGHIGC